MKRRLDLPDPEAGFTFIEVLVALMILGTAVIAILGALGTSIVLSDVHRDRVTADALVRTYAERLNNANYSDCAPPTYAKYQPGPGGINLTIPSRFNVSLVAIRYWNGDGNATNSATFSLTCPSPDKGIQQITISANSTDNRGRQQLTILKRKP